MKLLILIYSLGSGGAERVTANLANYWAEKGWQVTIATLSGTEDDFYRIHPAVQRVGLNLVNDSNHPVSAIINNLRRILALRRLLRQTKPDVGLAMMSTANILLALAAIGKKGLVTIGSEHIYPPSVPLGRIWEALRARCYRRLDVLVALTNESAVWLRQNTCARHIRVIPNAVLWPLPLQAPYLPAPARRKDEFRLLAVGRLVPQKGFDLLISAFQQLAADFPHWQLIILGEGPERKALEVQVQSVGLRERILLLGRAGNIGQWYEAADIYVMSSRFEGFPNTLAEAMAHSLPTVSFDCDTGPRDVIRHEVDGLLVPAGDVASLEASMRRLMSDAALRQRFAAKAVEVREHLSLERVVDLWQDVFDRARRQGV